MAKVFTVEFTYKGSTYSSLATVRTKGEELLVHIHLFDNYLSELLDEDELKFTIVPSHRRHTETHKPQVRELVSVLRQSVVQQLKQVNEGV